MFELFFDTFFNSIATLFNPLTFLIIGVLVAVYLISNKQYKETSYYKTTNTPLLALRSDVGKYGEYLIYKKLRNFETNLGAKFLFNVYIPKENGETTEIDVLMICSKGIFVFESKNYSGWIFGNESQRNWTQVLPKGRGRSNKEKFFNPIMQNRGHIKHLKSLVGDDIPMRSIIAFSERCTLKEITVTSTDVSVINRYSVSQEVTTLFNQYSNALDTKKVDSIYNLLYPFSQVDELAKQQHIQNIKNNITPQPVVTAAPATPEIISETVAEETEPTIASSVERPVLKCPKCNGELVLRTAKRGENKGNAFYGCSNYPKCKYIQEYIQQ